MRNWLKFYLQWHPPIMHDLHESQPLPLHLQRPVAAEPHARSDPVCRAAGLRNFEMTKMIAYGMPGVWTHAFVDMWSPGYLGFMSSNHNGMLRMYETFGNGGANTMPRTVGGGRPRGSGGRGRRRRWTRRARRRTDRARMVPARAASAAAHLVHAQQHQLHGDRSALGPRTHRRLLQDRARELLPEEPQFGEVGRDGSAVRLRAAGAAGHDAGRVHRQRSAPAGHRGRTRHRRSQTARRHVPRGLADHQAQPALRPARQDPAREAELSRPRAHHL